MPAWFRKRTSRYQRGYEDRIVDNKRRNKLIASLILEGRRRGYYNIVLVERVKHLENVSDLLAGVPHRVVSGSRIIKTSTGSISTKRRHVKVEQRLQSKEKFEAGNVRVILANKVFKKGVDIKRVDVMIDGAGMYSKDDAIQKFGRGVRKHADKSGLIYFDISDITETTGKAAKRNWFAKNAKSRKRAFKKAGIDTLDVDSRTMTAVEMYDRAERFLKKRLERKA